MKQHTQVTNCHSRTGYLLLVEASGASPPAEEDKLEGRLALWAEVTEEAARLARPQGVEERKALLPSGAISSQLHCPNDLFLGEDDR